MNDVFYYLLIAKLPYEPIANQVIYVEKEYNKEFGSTMLEIAKKYKENEFMYIPATERGCNRELSDHQFFDILLPKCKDLYFFMSGVLAGEPTVNADGYISFKPYKNSFDSVFDKGFIVYTGAKHNNIPIFEYFPLDSNSPDYIEFIIYILRETFNERNGYLQTQPTPLLASNGGRMLGLMVMNTRGESSKKRTYHEYLSYVHQLLYVDFEQLFRERISQDAKRKNFDKDVMAIKVIFYDDNYRISGGEVGTRYEAKFYPLDFCIYSYFIAQNKCLTIDEILQDGYLILQMYKIIFDRTTILDKTTISDAVRNVQKIISDTLTKGRESEDSTTIIAPFVIGCDESYKGGPYTYGIPICTKEGKMNCYGGNPRANGVTYVEDYRKKLEEITGLQLVKDIEPEIDWSDFSI